MKVIIYEDLKLMNPTRTINAIMTIIDETKPDMMLRSVSRSHPLIGKVFDDIKNNVHIIKSRYPNIKIIGNVFFQSIGRTGQDDITKERYTSQYAYNHYAMNPANFGITSMTKCEFQCLDDSCDCKSPNEEVKKGSFTPDITLPETQLLFLHQCEKILQTGADGIWIDGLMRTAKNLIALNATEENIQKCISGALYICEEIKKLPTLSGRVPMVSSWYGETDALYIIRNPNFRKGLFDFVTIWSPNNNEIKTISPHRNYENIVNFVHTHYGYIPIIAYIDWGTGKSPLWHFSQWFTGFTECCNASDTPENREKRKSFQGQVLTKFTEVFKEYNIDFAYPVHGGKSCNTDNCASTTGGPCCVKSFGEFYIYDSIAPQFQAYDKIVELMKKVPAKPPEHPIIVYMVVAGALIAGYFILKK